MFKNYEDTPTIRFSIDFLIICYDDAILYTKKCCLKRRVNLPQFDISEFDARGRLATLFIHLE